MKSKLSGELPFAGSNTQHQAQNFLFQHSFELQIVIQTLKEQDTFVLIFPGKPVDLRKVSKWGVTPLHPTFGGL